MWYLAYKFSIQPFENDLHTKKFLLTNFLLDYKYFYTVKLSNLLYTSFILYPLDA